jgi:hypothetical protein
MPSDKFTACLPEKATILNQSLQRGRPNFKQDLQHAGNEPVVVGTPILAIELTPNNKNKISSLQSFVSY